MAIGIKISKAGAGVGTADVDNLVLTSDIPLIKVKEEERETLGTPGTLVVPHGLPYTPIFWCFRNTNGTLTPGTLIPVYDDTSGERAYVDGTNLTIISTTFTGGRYYYYVFFDELGNYA